MRSWLKIDAGLAIRLRLLLRRSRNLPATTLAPLQSCARQQATLTTCFLNSVLRKLFWLSDVAIGSTRLNSSQDIMVHKTGLPGHIQADITELIQYNPMSNTEAGRGPLFLSHSKLESYAVARNRAMPQLSFLV